MPNLYTIAVNGKVKALDLNQVIHALSGVTGVPIRLDAVNDGSNYALTIRNSGGGGKGLLVQAADGSSIFVAAGTSVQGAIAGTLMDLVGVSATQTLTNKTLTAPAIAAAALSGILAITNGILKLAEAAAPSAGALTLPDTGNVFVVSGSTTITSITAKTAGTVVWLRFTGQPLLTHGANLDLGGYNLTPHVGQVLQLVSNGTGWHLVWDRVNKVARGTYVGNGAGSRTITLGFTPHIVFVQNEDGDRIWISLNGTSGSGLKLEDSGSPQVALIAALQPTAGGIALGSGSSGANDSGVTYYYYAAEAQ